MKHTLAIVLGTQTSWAVHTRKDGILSGTVDFPLRAEDHAAIRWIAFRDWLSSLLNTHNIHDVFVEMTNPSGTDAAKVYGAFHALLEIACYTHGCAMTEVEAGTTGNFPTGGTQENTPGSRVIAILHYGLSLNKADQQDT